MQTALRSEYQVYEDVSEGTHLSPIFSSADMLIAWLLAQGYSRDAAEAFLRFCPFVIDRDGSIVPGIEGLRGVERKS